MEEIKKELRKIIQSVKAYIESEKSSGIEEFYFNPLPKMSSLTKLEQEVIKCKHCSLCESRKNPVFGQGNPRAKLVFVGEAPGREEDLQGLPFVGQAGVLLTKIIEAMGLQRKDVYICNVLKCRPPQNRDPLPSEVAACHHYLRLQIEAINPKVICCLGRHAGFVLLNQDLPISKLRGKFYDYRGIKVMSTFHPAYLLRNPSAKRYVWEDVQKIMAELKR